jgi:hypothetical protein
VDEVFAAVLAVLLTALASAPGDRFPVPDPASTARRSGWGSSAAGTAHTLGSGVCTDAGLGTELSGTDAGPWSDRRPGR